MRSSLLHPAPPPADRPLDAGDADLARDLGVDDVVTAMAAGDDVVREAARGLLLHPVADLDVIRWRQDVVRDALTARAAIRELYDLAAHACAVESRGWWISSEPSSVLGRSVALLRELLGSLRDLRAWARSHAGFPSAGLSALVEEITATFTEDWFRDATTHLEQLSHPEVVITARLGPAGTSTDHVLAALAPARRSWLGRSRADPATIVVPETDTSGSDTLRLLREFGLRHVAETLAQAVDEVRTFFTRLRDESAFLVGCATLEERLRALGLPTAFPEVRPAGTEATASGLYDVGLAVRSGRAVVPNDLAADGVGALVITGANQGGKSTLLRAIGLAQLMAQAGMVVGASALRTSAVTRVHSHFRREEDAALRSGRLLEELVRMSALVDRVSPGDLVLLNEPFASTNEREGSRIARHLLDGLLEGGLRVAVVTHLTEFSHELAAAGRADVRFLRAERGPDGTRTFRVVPGDPLATSFGVDLWEQVFGRISP